MGEKRRPEERSTGAGSGGEVPADEKGVGASTASRGLAAESSPSVPIEQPKYKRILIKFSGEALMGERDFGIDPKMLQHTAEEIESVQELGVQVAVVIGGGNIFRGISAVNQGFDRVAGDQMGMLATVINGLALQHHLESHGVTTRLMTAVEIRAFAEPYIRRRAVRHLEKGRVVIFAAGTGHPYFTTDSAAALRAMEIGAELLLKATKVDGVYDQDPAIHRDAKLFKDISYLEVIQRGLKVMDLAAISLCLDNDRIPIVVFNVRRKGNIRRIVMGESVGSMVRG